MFGGRETSCVNAMDPHAKEEGLTRMETERKGKKPKGYRNPRLLSILFFLALERKRSHERMALLPPA